MQVHGCAFSMFDCAHPFSMSEALRVLCKCIDIYFYQSGNWWKVICSSLVAGEVKHAKCPATRMAEIVGGRCSVRRTGLCHQAGSGTP